MESFASAKYHPVPWAEAESQKSPRYADFPLARLTGIHSLLRGGDVPLRGMTGAKQSKCRCRGSEGKSEQRTGGQDIGEAGPTVEAGCRRLEPVLDQNSQQGRYKLERQSTLPRKRPTGLCVAVLACGCIPGIASGAGRSECAAARTTLAGPHPRRSGAGPSSCGGGSRC